MLSLRTGATAAAMVMASGSATLAVASCTPPPSPTCATSQLIARFESGQGAAGDHYETWQLINVGGTCQLRGWVNAVNLDAKHRPLPTTLDQLGGPPATIRLSTGQHASWTFHYLNPLILNCHPEPAVAMLITPPGNTKSILLSMGEQACEGSFDVHPLVAGG